jgi:hypothetical protein
LALFVKHGLDLERWPVGVRKALGIESLTIIMPPPAKRRTTETAHMVRTRSCDRRHSGSVLIYYVSVQQV